MDSKDKKKFTQHYADVLSINENILTGIKLEKIHGQDLRVPKDLFFRLDVENMNRLRQLGYSEAKSSYLLDFTKILAESGFAELMKDMLNLLSRIYDYPVDIEFTGSFIEDGFKVNLLQCRLV